MMVRFYVVVTLAVCCLIPVSAADYPRLMMVHFFVVVTLAVCCLIPVSAAADWLNSTCNSDSDCPEPNSACYRVKCLCRHGYYYSVSQHTCVEECAERDLQSTFLTYPGSPSVKDMFSTPSPYVHTCQQLCFSIHSCRAVFYVTGRCFLVDKTIESTRSAPFNYIADVSLHQRMCA